MPLSGDVEFVGRALPGYLDLYDVYYPVILTLLDVPS